MVNIDEAYHLHDTAKGFPASASAGDLKSLKLEDLREAVALLVTETL